MNVAVLSGGVGGARFLRGVLGVVDPGNVSIIGNVADDIEVLGLRVSPDLDSILYTLTGLADEERGWGRAGETWHALDTVAQLGGESWFRLGDRDIGLHLVRTELLRRGVPLSEATEQIAHGLGLEAQLLPATDDPVRTFVETPEGTFPFQTWFVARRHRDEVDAVHYAGAPEAAPAPGVLEAIASARGVIVCPSNPITSIGPILAVPGLLDALSRTDATTVAISPIVGSDAVSGPAGRLMAVSGLPVSVTGVARAYAAWLDVLVFDERDIAQSSAVRELGVSPATAQTIMASRADESALARRVLDVLS